MALRVANVAGGQVHVRHSKGGRPRSVPRSSGGIEFFERATAGRSGDKLVFPRENGKDWKRIDASRGMKRACKAAKIEPPAVFHDLRRSYGSLLLNRGAEAQYPSASNGAVSSNTDCEQYEANSNVLQKRLRDGLLVNYTYDNLNRRHTITYSDSGTSPTDSNITETYDNLDRLVSSSDTKGHYVSFTYDALGRKVTEASAAGTKVSHYDAAGRRTSLTWPDGFVVDYDYLLTGEMSAVRENGATSGVGVLATFSYDNLGRRTALVRGNGTTTTYGYDGASRLTQLAQDFAGTATDQTQWLAYNPANQIISQANSNVAYAWTRTYNHNDTYVHNGLNQYTAAGSTSLTYDGRGNLTTGLGGTFSYNSKNQLWKSSASGATFYYDPAGRMDRITASGGRSWTTLDYDGNRLITELSNSGAVLRRYVYGPNADEPLVWYEGAGTSDRRWLHADERGSITAISDASGSALTMNSYDEYGVPESTNGGRFQYTGQAWVPELGLYYYKARMYSPLLGRFMQADPIGYADDLNLYSYVANDPLDAGDPSGEYLCTDSPKGENCTAVANALAHAAQVEPHMTGKAKDRLAAVLAFYGQPGDKNGVTVNFSPDVDMGQTVMNKDGTITITFMAEFSKMGTGWAPAKNADVQASAVAHEGSHGIDDLAAGHGPRSHKEAMVTERTAYELQSEMHQAFGTKDISGTWDPAWSPSQVNELRAKGIENAALNSASIWCVKAPEQCVQ